MLCWDSRARTCFIPLSWLCGTTTTTYHERKFIFVIIIIIVIRCRRCHHCCHHQSIVGNEKIICPHPTPVSSRTDLSHTRRSNMAEITLRETEKFVQVWVLFPSQLLPAKIYVHEIDFVSHNAPSHHIISHEQTHTHRHRHYRLCLFYRLRHRVRIIVARLWTLKKNKSMLSVNGNIARHSIYPVSRFALHYWSECECGLRVSIPIIPFEKAIKQINYDEIPYFAITSYSRWNHSK